MWRFVCALVLVAVAGLPTVAVLEARAEPTGSALPGLRSYDEFMTALMRKWDVSGGSLVVARHDKLLLARGYGVADRSRHAAVEPTSLFRLASLSKTVTAVTVLTLVQDGRLRLDDKVLPILGEIGPRPGKITDTRVHDITVRHLLQHAGGFDRARSGDVVFLPRAPEAAKRQGGPLPPDCPTLMRDTLERTLDFAPGTRFAYANIGYCILGRVIERVTRTPYEAYVRTHVLARAGATRMKVGRTLTAAEGEVTYYDYEAAKEVSAMPGLGPKRAPQPYGAFAVETMDSYGGWIGAPVDYLRFILAIDGRRGAALLGAATIAQMNATTGLREAATEDYDGGNAGGPFYGLGIRVRPVKGGLTLWHTGSLPGTSTIAVRTADGFAWVAAFNGRPKDKNAFRGDLDRGLWTAKNAVRQWPKGDLFGAADSAGFYSR
jgi:CubicO group peptidase (beta-lactamase class C family)